jgi:hypothetical protein
MLYETLIAPFCISSKLIMACTLLSLIYAPADRVVIILIITFVKPNTHLTLPCYDIYVVSLLVAK